MRIEVRTVHLGKNSWAVDRAEEFVRKVSHFEKIELKLMKDESRLLKGIEAGEKIVVCDERGKSLSSIEFSKKVSQFRDGGIQKLVFFIGGPFGLPKSLVERADLNLSLSSLVLNQEVALTVLMEQIFRAYTIINNHPYHNP